MSKLEELTVRVKMASSRALQTKMDRHDLSEELPLRWEEIPAMAEAAYAAHQELMAAHAALHAARSSPS